MPATSGWSGAETVTWKGWMGGCEMKRLPSVSMKVSQMRGAMKPSGRKSRRALVACSASQRPPPSTKAPQRLLLFGLRSQVAGVGDQHVRGADGFRVRERLPHAHPDVVVLGQQLQQLKAGEIGVVEGGR